ncbi:Gfo/Idh/MocA family oxidoreductase [Pseudactinotalea sp.]|uniref:Gfo/Idh/MocA family oxidoreductase n=1 Tax=Pseudactinotalea sp. TaxID=1926260 RepID=UPI003B3AADE2
MVTTIALIGAGYRSHTFARVIAAVPERLQLAGAVVRDPQRAAEFAAEHRTTTWPSLAEADLDGVDVVVVAVPGSASARVIAELKDRGPVVLAETPPGVDMAELEALCALERDGLRIQVAEQYHLEPLIAAQIAIARSGLLGEVTQAQVAVAHGYHGVSVLRRALGVAFEDATITATTVLSPVRLGPSRYGDPDEDRMVNGTRTLAWLDFGDRHGVFDFDDQQYRNWARSPSLLVRGTDGELRDLEVRRFLDARTPLTSRLERVAAGGPGSHEGLFLRGYTFEGSWQYSNPYLRARLAEDELSIARILDLTGEYARGGPAVYSLAEAAQDRYLDLAIQRAAETGERVRTTRQPWAG